MYLHGRGVEIDHKKAYEHFSKSADNGYVYSLSPLGKMYLNGWHVDKDQEKGFNLIHQVADHGDAAAMWDLGMLYRTGTGHSIHNEYSSFWKSSGNTLVTNIQRALAIAGYDVGPLDGMAGSRTRYSIAMFQYDHGLAVEGRATTSVLKTLNKKTEEIRNNQITLSDQMEWSRIHDSNDPSDFTAYLESFSSPLYESLARSRIDKLSRNKPPTNNIQLNRSKIGSYKAILIGIDNYTNYPKLKTPLKDIHNISKILSEDYLFETIEVINPSRREIFSIINSSLNNATPEDHIIIYYAGHGLVDQETDSGYWVPVDSIKDNDYDLIDVDTITKKISKTKAAHVLVVADSCYSGMMTRGLLDTIKFKDDDLNLASYMKIQSRKARIAITSGGVEPVTDSGGGENSVFAQAFIQSLSRNTSIISSYNIFGDIRDHVTGKSHQIPEYAPIFKSGHDGGDFIFIHKSSVY